MDNQKNQSLPANDPSSNPTSPNTDQVFVGTQPAQATGQVLPATNQPVVFSSTDPGVKLSKRGSLPKLILFGGSLILVIAVALALYLTVFHKSASKNLTSSKSSSINSSQSSKTTQTSTSQSSSNTNASCSGAPSETLQCYNVSPGGSDVSYSLLFFKGATVQTTNGAPAELVSTTSGAEIEVNQTTAPANCGLSNEFSFTYKSVGQTGCYYLATSQTPNNNNYNANLVVNSQIYNVSLVAQNPVTLSTVESIFSSINIQ